jgi:pimeloyl-ACP methyl ester carboxylesterase
MTLTTLPRFKLTPSISAWRGGDGPSIVLIHGVGLNSDAWYAMLPELVKHFTVTIVDMPGHGESRPLTTETSPTLGSYSSSISEALLYCSGRSTIIGHSMGALVAMDLAINHTQSVSGIVALNAVYRRSDTAAKAVQARANNLLQTTQVDNSETLTRWFGDDPQGSLRVAADRCDRMLASTSIRAYADAYSVFAQNDGPSGEELAGCNVPMLFITGANEPNSTPKMSVALAAAAQNGECRVVDGARHMMPITHAEQVNCHILDYTRSRGIGDG